MVVANKAKKYLQQSFAVFVLNSVKSFTVLAMLF
jgi:hypothetical protein